MIVINMTVVVATTTSGGGGDDDDGDDDSNDDNNHVGDYGSNHDNCDENSHDSIIIMVMINLKYFKML